MVLYFINETYDSANDIANYCKYCNTISHTYLFRNLHSNNKRFGRTMVGIFDVLTWVPLANAGVPTS